MHLEEVSGSGLSLLKSAGSVSQIRSSCESKVSTVTIGVSAIPGAKLRAKLAKPAIEIVAHFVLTLIVILAIAGTEYTLGLLHLSARMVPFFKITVSDWLFDLDCVSATLINAVGMIKAVIVLWRS